MRNASFWVVEIIGLLVTVEGLTRSLHGYRHWRVMCLAGIGVMFCNAWAWGVIRVWDLVGL